MGPTNKQWQTKTSSYKFIFFLYFSSCKMLGSSSNDNIMLFSNLFFYLCNTCVHKSSINVFFFFAKWYELCFKYILFSIIKKSTKNSLQLILTFWNPYVNFFSRPQISMFNFESELVFNIFCKKIFRHLHMQVINFKLWINYNM